MNNKKKLEIFSAYLHYMGKKLSDLIEQFGEYNINNFPLEEWNKFYHPIMDEYTFLKPSYDFWMKECINEEEYEFCNKIKSINEFVISVQNLYQDLLIQENK